MGTRNAKPQTKDRDAFDAFFTSPSSNNDDKQVEEGSDARWIPLDHIKTRPQPRRYFDEQKIKELAGSFIKQGFRGAINVRPLGDNTYELIAGERRYRAASLAGLEKVRCFIDDYTDEDALRFALAENLLREDLSKLEEIEGILELIELEHGVSRDQTLKLIQSEGHHRNQVGGNVSPSEEFQKIEGILSHFGIKVETFRTKYIKGLSLPPELKEVHMKGHLAFNAALELGKVKDEQERSNLLEEAISKRLSFRAMKERIQSLGAQRSEAEPEILSLVQRLEATAKRAKKVEHQLETGPKKKRLEKLLCEIELLLGSEE